MSGFDKVRSLERGLQILEAVNRHNTLKAQDVARVTGIPRPTAYRMLETLEELGYVVRGPSDDAWRPTLKTKSLSSGFRDEDWIAQVAFPRMMKLGREALWPLDLVTFRDFRMVIRESTHAISPYSIDHGMVGRGLPILETSGGRAWLAFSGAEERRLILDGLRQRAEDDHPLLHNPDSLDLVLAQSRSLGVGFRTRGFNPNTMSISAPIFRDDRVWACMTMIWISSAMSFELALERFVPRLVATAGEISQELADYPLETAAQ